MNYEMNTNQFGIILVLYLEIDYIERILETILKNSSLADATSLVSSLH